MVPSEVGCWMFALRRSPSGCRQRSAAKESDDAGVRGATVLQCYCCTVAVLQARLRTCLLEHFSKLKFRLLVVQFWHANCCLLLHKEMFLAEIEHSTAEVGAKVRTRTASGPLVALINRHTTDPSGVGERANADGAGCFSHRDLSVPN